MTINSLDIKRIKNEKLYKFDSLDETNIWKTQSKLTQREIDDE